MVNLGITVAGDRKEEKSVRSVTHVDELQFAVGRADAQENVVGEEEALSWHLLVAATEGASEAALSAQLFPREHLQHVALPHEDLIDVQQDVTAADDDAFDGQVLANVLRFTDFVVHLLGQLFQAALGVVQALALHVIVRRVGQQLVQRNDVPGNLGERVSEWVSGR